MKYLALAALLVSPSMAYALFDDDDLEKTYTATRIAQNPHQSPYSITRVNSELIDDLQISNLPDLLRYVAGMVVERQSGNDYKINYHGLNGYIQRRMQILLNGVSLIRPSYAQVNINNLPLSIRDVEYLEVIRGSTSPTFGANALMATINIVTKDPAYEPKISFDQHIASDNKRESVLSHSGKKSGFDYRVSINVKEDGGFEYKEDGLPQRDSLERYNINLNAVGEIADNASINIYVSHLDSIMQLDEKDPNQTSSPDIESDFTVGNVSIEHIYNPSTRLKHSLNYTNFNQELEWNTCYPTILFSNNLKLLALQNRDYVVTLINGGIPSGGTDSDNALRDAVLFELSLLGSTALDDTCGNINENGMEEKYELETEITHTFNNNLRSNVGLGFTKENVTSETFLDSNAESFSSRLRASAEYNHNRMTLNGGIMIEHEPDVLEKPAISYRLGLNYRLNQSTTLRYAFSEGYRTPDILDKELRWEYVMSDIEQENIFVENGTAQFFQTALGNKDLESEKVKGNEIGIYYTKNSSFTDMIAMRPAIDLRIFHDSLSSLVSEKPLFTDYSLTNNSETTLEGFDIQLKLLAHPSNTRKWRINEVGFGGSITNNESTSESEKILHADKSYSFYTSAKNGSGKTLFISTNGTSDVAGSNYKSHALGFSSPLKIGGGMVNLGLKYTYLGKKDDHYKAEGTTDFNFVDSQHTINLRLHYNL